MEEKYQGVVVKVNEKPYYAELTIKEVIDLVGGIFDRGYVEVEGKMYDVYVNDEGILINLPYNRGYHGNLFVSKFDDYEDEVGKMTQEEVKQVIAYYENYNRFGKYTEEEQQLFEYLSNTGVMGYYAEGGSSTTISFNEFMMVVEQQLEQARKSILGLLLILQARGDKEELDSLYQQFLNDLARAF